MLKTTLSLLMLVASLGWSASLTTLQKTGPDSNRIRLIIVGDGFPLNQIEAYKGWTDSLVNAIFSSEPFKTYKNLFNVYRVNTISPDSGISDDFEQYYITNTFNTTATAIGTLATDTGLLADTLRMLFPNWSYNLKKSFVLLIANSSAPIVDGYKLADNVSAVCFRSSLQKTGFHKFAQLFGNLDPRCTIFNAQILEKLVSQHHQKVRLTDGCCTARQDVALCMYSNTFTVKMADTTNLKFDINWYLNGRKIEGAGGFSYAMAAQSLNMSTTNQIVCRFRDISIFKYPISYMDSALFNPLAVPDSIMTDSVVWTINSAVGTENSNKAQAQSKPSLGVQRSGNGFEFSISTPVSFELGVYDIRGRLIRMLGQGNHGSAGKYSFQPKAAGVYIARLITNGQTLSKVALLAD